MRGYVYAFVGFIIVLVLLWTSVDIGPAEEPVDDAQVDAEALDTVPCHEPTGYGPEE